MAYLLFNQLATSITPDTSSYMIAGFTVIFGLMLIYLISLIVRFRNLRRDLQILQGLEQREGEKELQPGNKFSA